MSASAASIVVPGETKRTSRVITSEMGVAFGSRPARTTRTQVALGEDAGHELVLGHDQHGADVALGHHRDRVGTLAEAGTEISSSLRVRARTPLRLLCIVPLP